MAKLCTGCGISKPEGAFYPDPRLKSGLRGACNECMRARSRKWAAANPEKVIAKNAAFYAADPAGQRARASEHYRKNAPTANARARRWMRENQERHQQSRRDWVERNRAVLSLHCNNRRAAAMRATPSWANRFFMEEAYRLAQLRTRLTGFQWHVDVCGLNWEGNMQVIPATVNVRKHNLFWPDMPHGGEA
jgi:hypothetical protein